MKGEKGEDRKRIIQCRGQVSKAVNGPEEWKVKVGPLPARLTSEEAA